MKTPNGLPKTDRMCLLIPMRRTTFWTFIPTDGLLRNGNELVCHLHWQWERLIVNRSNQLPLLKLSYAIAKCRMLLRGFTWLSFKSHLVDEDACVLQIASGQLNEL